MGRKITLATILAAVCAAVLATMPAAAQDRGPDPAQPRQKGMTLEELKARLKKEQGRAGTPPQARPQVEKPRDPATYAGEPELWGRISELVARLPEDVRQSGLSTEQLHAIVDELMSLLRYYGTHHGDGPHLLDVLYQQARLMAMNTARHVYQASERYKAEHDGQTAPVDMRSRFRKRYLAGAEAAVQRAMSLDPSPEMVRKLDRALGQIFYFSYDFPRAVEQYRKILEKYPEDADSAENQTALIGALEKSRSFADGAAECRKFLERHLASRFTPHVLNTLAKMLLYSGRAEEAIAHLDRHESFMRRAEQGKEIQEHGGLVYPSEVRQDFSTYLDRWDFQRGFAHYALGDVTAAEQALARCVETLRAKADARKLNQVGQVFLGRADRVLQTLRSLQGRPAPAIDLGPHWVDGTAIDLAAERESGHVVALFFCPYENPRSDEFMQALQKYYSLHWGDGLRCAWIAMPKGRRDPAGQLQRIAADASRLGVTFPVGLSTSGEEWPPQAYADYNITPGTPTLVLVDRSGKVAWYKMDPTFRDFEIGARVFGRLLMAKP